ncbi:MULTISPECIES: AbrB/MazE/SpoVT family DNA-binding domain-containing protein [Bifidobacterium]|uniref:Transcriptional regulator/antitoxin, MazE n=2 Tax=Bifidobacterium TaxID=1678 RepID=A0A261FL95_9BIFI|nr:MULTISPECIES: AbrB/MazE/SpoVT family DNA-binding domain-containing protein [Bifidobacterium]OZG59775.1 Transcriptional regulator/antitoxin, MazE [Bifidobacterium lemurum]OZG65255.1 Transcriptional regulator/antitoxin, MazE [Bifidobacterium eulemuris]QOL32327.1 AbrB/MazE/SpoVT family DNA-binding domain-containing protein [Bifidobacterium eulemuris]QOL35061.1 AbrB/MazE/SpoVT family DNA-binding domain-containing protein [Bifidobacterium lemurum]
MATIAKWGNSEAIRIPKEIRDQTGLREGSEVTIEADGGNIVIKPKTVRITRIGRYAVPNLADLFADYHGGYQAKEDGFGDPVGAETI